jgi:TolB protein
MSIMRRPFLLSLCLCVSALAPVFAQAAPKKIAHFRDFIQHLSWSPDGKKFLFTRIHKGQMGLWTLNADGGEPKPLLAKWTTPHFDASWSPDSQRIVFIYDILQGTDGKLQIDIVNADGSGQKNLLPHKAFDEAPRWSPDGKWIAFASTRDKNQDIWLITPEGKDLKRLTSDTGPDNAPAWSPDSKKIAFTSGRAGNLDIWVMNAGGGEQKRLTADPKMDYWPVWSPDGKKIAFTSNRTGNYEIFVMGADGSKPANVSNHPGTDNFAAWSPDSRRLAFISNRDGGYGVYVVDCP